jgi:hypothetical protein
MSSSFFGKGKDIQTIPILNSSSSSLIVKKGDKLGCFEEIHPEDLFEINSFHIEMDEYLPPRRSLVVTEAQLALVRI